jgi:hypothetical protein
MVSRGDIGEPARNRLAQHAVGRARDIPGLEPGHRLPALPLDEARAESVPVADQHRAVQTSGRPRHPNHSLVRIGRHRVAGAKRCETPRVDRGTNPDHENDDRRYRYDPAPDARSGEPDDRGGERPAGGQPE